MATDLFLWRRPWTRRWGRCRPRVSLLPSCCNEDYCMTRSSVCHAAAAWYIRNGPGCRKNPSPRHLTWWWRTLVHTFFSYFFFIKVFGGHIHTSFFRATGTPILDFWWLLLWVSKPKWVLPYSHFFGGECKLWYILNRHMQSKYLNPKQGSMSNT